MPCVLRADVLFFTPSGKDFWSLSPFFEANNLFARGPSDTELVKKCQQIYMGSPVPFELGRFKT